MPHWKCSLDCRDCLLGGNRLFGHSSSVGLDRSIEVIAVVIDFDFIRVGHGGNILSDRPGGRVVHHDDGFVFQMFLLSFFYHSNQ